MSIEDPLPTSTAQRKSVAPPPLPSRSWLVDATGKHSEGCLISPDVGASILGHFTLLNSPANYSHLAKTSRSGLVKTMHAAHGTLHFRLILFCVIQYMNDTREIVFHHCMTKKCLGQRQNETLSLQDSTTSEKCSHTHTHKQIPEPSVGARRAVPLTLPLWARAWVQNVVITVNVRDLW